MVQTAVSRVAGAHSPDAVRVLHLLRYAVMQSLKGTPSELGHPVIQTHTVYSELGQPQNQDTLESTFSSHQYHVPLQEATATYGGAPQQADGVDGVEMQYLGFRA